MFTPDTANIYMVILIMVQLTVSVGLSVIGGVTRLPYGIMLCLSQILCFGAPFWGYLRLTHKKPRNILDLNSLTPKNIFFIIVMSITVQPAMMVVSSIMSLLFENNVPSLISGLSSEYSFLTALMIISLPPAVFEEITFRGVIAHSLSRLNIFKAAVLNGFYFAVIHLSFQQFPYTFLLGVVMFIALKFSGTIFAPMVMHFIINMSQIALYYAVQVSDSDSGPFNFLSQNNISNIYIDRFLIFNLVLFSIIFIISLALFIRTNKTRINCQTNDEKVRIITPSFVFLILLYLTVTAIFVHQLI